MILLALSSAEVWFCGCTSPDSPAQKSGTAKILMSSPTKIESAFVLVAEDQPEIQHAIQLLLKMEGHRVELASSPDEAMAAIAHNQFDLLLLDLNYHRDTTSGDEGLKLLEDLRAMRYPAPVVAMTAWGSIDLAVEAMHRGACDFVQKPWDNDHLLRIVNKHVEAGRVQRRTRRRQQLEIQDAVDIQRRLMPRDLPKLPGLSIAGECRPAGDMGGDYFDVFTMGKKIGICIADVIGKGLPAALIMSNLQAGVKVTAAEWVGPAELCGRVNELICKNGASDKFISFFYAVLDPETRHIQYSNCGHNPPILWHTNGAIERLDVGGTLLGLRCEERYSEGHVDLAAGDRLVLFTDGISEAGMSTDNEYGEQRIIELLQNGSPEGARSFLDMLLRDVGAHCDQKFDDDVTCVVVAADDATVELRATS